MGFSAFKKGLIYIVNYFILFIGFLFLFLDCYFDREKDWIKKTHSYIFIVSGALMWIIGILKIINQGFLSKDIVHLRQIDYRIGQIIRPQNIFFGLKKFWNKLSHKKLIF